MSARTLLVTRDEPLLEDMLRLAAAGGVTLDVAHDVPEAVRGWSGAGLVLVGADLLDGLAAALPPRRTAVHVVGHAPVADGCFRQALAVGAENVVELPAADDWMVELLTDAADGVSGHARTIALMGGSGGAGATTFAAALAVTAAESIPVTLVDTDPLGGGVDRVVGLESCTGVRWDTLTRTRGRIGARFLRESLPQADDLAVLAWGSGPPPEVDPAAAREALSAAQRGSSLVVLDLPRHQTPMTAELLGRCDDVVLVAGLTVPAAAAAARVTAALGRVAARLHLAVRGGGALSPDEVAAMLGVPLLVEIGEQRRLAESVDLGLGPVHARRGRIARAAREALSLLGGGPDGH
jgi:secretion/DNA translocation related CpaE-like protein